MSELAAELANQLGAAHLAADAGIAAVATVTGPSIRVIGRSLGQLTEWRMRNFLRLGEKLEARVGDEPPGDDQEVHPRVIHEVLDRGTWTDDDVAQEYLAGLLVSSRSPDGADEEAAYLASIVAGLTATQIRLHHALYAPLNGHGHQGGTGLQIEATSRLLNVYLPFAEVFRITGREDSADAFIAIRSAVAALAKERLIGAEYGLGGASATYLQTFLPPGTVGGLLTYPTALGVEVFLRAYGINRMEHNQLLEGLELPDLATDMPIADGALVGRGRVG